MPNEGNVHNFEICCCHRLPVFGSDSGIELVRSLNESVSEFDRLEHGGHKPIYRKSLGHSGLLE
jgi:uncharacterized protein YfeS